MLFGYRLLFVMFTSSTSIEDRRRWRHVCSCVFAIRLSCPLVNHSPMTVSVKMHPAFQPKFCHSWRYFFFYKSTLWLQFGALAELPILPTVLFSNECLVKNFIKKTLMIGYSRPQITSLARKLFKVPTIRPCNWLLLFLSLYVLTGGRAWNSEMSIIMKAESINGVATFLEGKSSPLCYATKIHTAMVSPFCFRRVLIKMQTPTHRWHERSWHRIWYG